MMTAWEIPARRRKDCHMKMVPIREQVGISLVPGATPGIDNEPGSPGAVFLERAYNAMLTELFWWVAALTPARAAAES